MADWIEVLTQAGTTLVNLDRVDCIIPDKKGARVVFSGLEDDFVTSLETPDMIIVKMKVRRDA